MVAVVFKVWAPQSTEGVTTVLKILMSVLLPKSDDFETCFGWWKAALVSSDPESGISICLTPRVYDAAKVCQALHLLSRVTQIPVWLEYDGVDLQNFALSPADVEGAIALVFSCIWCWSWVCERRVVSSAKSWSSQCVESACWMSFRQSIVKSGDKHPLLSPVRTSKASMSNRPRTTLQYPLYDFRHSIVW